MRPGVAAGHPADFRVGAEILAAGGTAADAVVAMALTSCVAETVYSGLARRLPRDRLRRLARHEPRRLRGRSRPRRRPRRPTHRLRGRARRVFDRSASCAVPGLPDALGELWAVSADSRGDACASRHSTWHAGASSFPEMHERSLDMSGELCTRSAVVGSYSSGTIGCSGGRAPRTAGDGAETLEALSEEGAASVYRGSIAESCVHVDGLVV